MANDIDPLLIQRYLAGDCTPTERERVIAWLGSAPGRQAEIDAYGRLIDEWAALGSGGSRAVKMLHRLHGIIDADGKAAASAIGVEADQAAVRARRPLPVSVLPSSRFVGFLQGRPWAAIAACVLVALGVGIAIRSPRLGSPTRGREYATAPGQRLHVTLTDGTQFTLAPASRLRVAADYGRAPGAREVDLDGEGFFAVVHNAAHPFRVRTPSFVATDVGTAFDVRAYAEDATAAVAVRDGAVAIAVCAPRAASTCTTSTSLRAGDVATFRDTSVAVAHGANVVAVTAWMSGELDFQSVPISDVARALSRWYNLTVDASDPALLDREITLKVSTQTADEALAAVALIAHARLERQGRRIRLVPIMGDQ
jgi:ferric-dicitrate binding protein FerR (iron transport regulator)